MDIDFQAVEVSKLSLLLKVLEGENKDELDSQLKLFRDRVLPNLNNNIKCGNSLVNTDIFGGQLFPEDQVLKINPFDWNDEQKGFGKIMKSGGFDAVIGNPPYIKEYTSREIFEDIKKTKLKKYYQGKMDLWYFFVCHGLDLLHKKGWLSFIAPNNWISNAGASILRNKVLQNSKIINYVDFSNYKVFTGAGIQTMVFALQKQKTSRDYTLTVNKVTNSKLTESELASFLNSSTKSSNIEKITCNISPKNMQDKTISFVDSELNDLLEKILEKGSYFLDNNSITNGIHHHHDYINKDRKSILKENFKVGDGIFVLSNLEKSDLNLLEHEESIVKPTYTSKQLNRYSANSKNEEWVIYTDSSFKDKNKIKQFPSIKNHLDKFKKVITSDNRPYGLHRARKEEFFIGEKIISIRKCPSYPRFSYVDFDSYVSAAFYVMKPKDINLKYLTGLLNSTLIAFWLKHKGKMQGDNYQIDKAPLLEIPLIKLEDKEREQLMINLVEQMLELHKKTATDPHSKEMIQRQISATDKEIDRLVYELYGLSEEEIRTVEKGV